MLVCVGAVNRPVRGPYARWRERAGVGFGLTVSRAIGKHVSFFLFRIPRGRGVLHNLTVGSTLCRRALGLRVGLWRHRRHPLLATFLCFFDVSKAILLNLSLLLFTHQRFYIFTLFRTSFPCGIIFIFIETIYLKSKKHCSSNCYHLPVN